MISYCLKSFVPYDATNQGIPFYSRYILGYLFLKNQIMTIVNKRCIYLIRINTFYTAKSNCFLNSFLIPMKSQSSLYFDN